MQRTSQEAEDRITRLEEIVAHQALAIEEMSAQLAQQWKTVDQLQRTVVRLVERFQSLEDTTLEAPAITRPPHY